MGVILSSLFTSNLLLTKFFGVELFSFERSQKNSLLELLYSLLFVMFFSSSFCYLLYFYIIIPFELEVLFISFIVISIFFSSLLFMFFAMFYSDNFCGRIKDNLYSFGFNSLFFAVLYLNMNNEASFLLYNVQNILAVLGFFLILYIFILVKERVNFSSLPKYISFEVILLLFLGLLSLSFSGLGSVLN